MGRMKDLYIDEINRQLAEDADWDAPTFDGAGFSEEDREPDPLVVDPGQDPADVPPVKIDPISGKKMWEIKGYRIWAQSYGEALQLLPIIESF